MKSFRRKQLSKLHEHLLLFIILPVILVWGVTLFVLDGEWKNRPWNIVHQEHVDQLQAIGKILEKKIQYDGNAKETWSSSKHEVEHYFSDMMKLSLSVKHIALYTFDDNKVSKLYSSGESIGFNNHLSSEYINNFFKKDNIEVRLGENEKRFRASLILNLGSGRKGILVAEYQPELLEYIYAHEDSQMMVIVINLSMMVLITYLALYVYLKKTIVLPSRKILDAVKEMGEGKMNVNVNVEGENEIWQIGMAFNKMTEYVSEYIENEKNKVRELNVMNEAVSDLASQTDMRNVLELASRHARNLVKSQYSFIFMREKGTEKIEYYSFDGYGEETFTAKNITFTGIVSRVLDESDLVIIDDNIDTPEKLGLPPGHPDIKNLLAVPLILSGEVIGLVGVVNKAGKSFAVEGGDMLFTFAIQAMMAIEKASLFEKTKKLAVTDGLTGLLNHREFQRKLGDEVDRAKRYDRNLSLLLLDIDFFKKFNDTYGHQFGDKVLKEVAEILSSCLRNVDYAARYGGEEFTIILPETEMDWAIVVAERVRKAVSLHQFITDKGESTTLTVSIGVAVFPSDSDIKEKLITCADNALYAAKKSGRNMVCLFSDAKKLELEKNKVSDILKIAESEKYDKLAESVDNKNPFNSGHSQKVAKYALLLGDAIGMAEQDKQHLKTASILHDIGTLSIPDEILDKPGPLNDEERKIVQAHPGLAEMILGDTSSLSEILPIILYHHERIDGKGYPNGLSGSQIPVEAKILAIAEAFIGMTSSRPYRDAMSKEDALKVLKESAGQQFDQNLVDVFLKILIKKSEAA